MISNQRGSESARGGRGERGWYDNSPYTWSFLSEFKRTEEGGCTTNMTAETGKLNDFHMTWNFFTSTDGSTTGREPGQDVKRPSVNRFSIAWSYEVRPIHCVVVPGIT